MKKIIYSALALALIASMVLILKKNKETKDYKDSQNIVQSVFPVKVADVSESQRVDKLSLVGTVIANNDVNVTSETTGRITKCNIQVGQRVNAGFVLFQVDDEMKLAQLKTAEANFEKAVRDSSRTKYLVSEKSMSAAQWDAIELQYKVAEQTLIQARRAYNDTRIKSPISGVVASRYADVGTMVNNSQSGTIVCNIVDISRVKVRLNIAEKDFVKINTGEKVSVSSEVYPGESFSGTVTAIGVKGDESHTYPVEITIDNKGTHQLKAGMFARVMFEHSSSTKSLVIPRESIVGSVRDAKVFVLDGTTAKLKSIVLGADVEGKLEVVSGLQLGDRVVTTGQNTIGDGSTVSVVE